MNKKHFLLLLLGVIMAGCTSDEVITDDGSLPADTEVEASTGGYLSISIVSAQSTGTRAAGDVYPGKEDGEENGELYQDGTSEENKVNQVRFFFFDDKGAAIGVKKNSASGTYNSYIDWYPSNADNSGPEHDETVEKVLTATLGLSFEKPEGDGSEKKPASVLAVINPTENILGWGKRSETNQEELITNPDLADLQEIISDYKTGLHASNFVMSNSVYVKNEETKPEVVYVTAITEDNICLTLEEAIDNPVTIYVERVLARLDFKVDMDPADKIGENDNLDNTIFKVKKTKETTDDNYEVNGNKIDIYVKLLGWNITATASKSRLVKEIYPSWTSAGLFGSNSTLRWNTSDYHRSFWALNPTLDENDDFLYGNFGENVASKGKGKDENGVAASDYPASFLSIPSGTVYLQENANEYSTDMDAAAPVPATKVIIAAQLLDDKGAPLTLAEWAYKKYTLDGLKQQLVGTVLNNLYKRTEKDENGEKETVYTQIEKTDLTFKTAQQLGETKEENPDADYYVYAVLTDEAAKATWTLGEGKNASVYNNYKEVNKYIRDAVNHAKVWNNGMTYYFFDVKHLGGKGSPGEFGIVRNHLYKTTVTSITGLGTPVYDPDQTIYPEKPEDDESIVSAEVKILSWRIVNSSYDLTW